MNFKYGYETVPISINEQLKGDQRYGGVPVFNTSANSSGNYTNRVAMTPKYENRGNGYNMPIMQKNNPVPNYGSTATYLSTPSIPPMTERSHRVGLGTEVYNGYTVTLPPAAPSYTGTATMPPYLHGVFPSGEKKMKSFIDTRPGILDANSPEERVSNARRTLNITFDCSRVPINVIFIKETSGIRSMNNLADTEGVEGFQFISITNDQLEEWLINMYTGGTLKRSSPTTVETIVELLKDMSAFGVKAYGRIKYNLSDTEAVNTKLSDVTNVVIDISAALTSAKKVFEATHLIAEIMELMNSTAVCSRYIVEVCSVSNYFVWDLQTKQKSCKAIADILAAWVPDKHQDLALSDRCMFSRVVDGVLITPFDNMIYQQSYLQSNMKQDIPYKTSPDIAKGINNNLRSLYDLTRDKAMNIAADKSKLQEAHRFINKVFDVDIYKISDKLKEKVISIVGCKEEKTSDVCYPSDRGGYNVPPENQKANKRDKKVGSSKKGVNSANRADYTKPGGTNPGTKKKAREERKKK